MLNMTREYEEKRNFIRMTINSPAEVTLIDGTVRSVTCIDLSSSGVQFETFSPPPLGVELEFRLPAGKNDVSPMAASIQVCRVMEVAPETYRVGATITEFL